MQAFHPFLRIGSDRAALPRRRAQASHSLTLASPALTAMTDFCCEGPAVTTADRHIDDALRDMITIGIRALLVVEGESVLGLITANDIMGERPILFLQSPLCAGSPCRHSDIHVADVMTGVMDLQTLPFDWVERATIATVVERFMNCDQSHLVVVSVPGKDGSSTLRGLFSRTRLERDLGHSLARHG